MRTHHLKTRRTRFNGHNSRHRTAVHDESSVVAPHYGIEVAGIWSALLTPIFGSVDPENWQAIGEQARQAGRIWLAVSIAVILVFGTNYWVHLLYLFTWYFAWPKKQARYVNERWERAIREAVGCAMLMGLGIVVVLAVALVGGSLQIKALSGRTRIRAM